MTKYILILLLFISCSRKSNPQIIYQDKLITSYDTIIDIITGGVDTIYSTRPCDSFTVLVREKDTIYIRQIKKVIETKLVTKRDTVLRNIIINNPQPKKIDNSVTAKKGSIIGNDNVMTTKKSSWWWIFLCGMLVMFLIQNVGFRVLKTYFPFLKFLP